jgi:hypothetical protein
VRGRDGVWPDGPQVPHVFIRLRTADVDAARRASLFALSSAEHDLTSAQGDATYTGAAAYNPLVLPVPPVPTGLAQVISYALSPQVPNAASIAQRGDFYGFSIEMSVVNQTRACPLVFRSMSTEAD